MPRGLPVARADLKLATVVAGTFDDELVVRATVAPAHSVLLDATDGGRVDTVLATDGATVAAGELLYRLSNPQREQEVLARSADVAQQLANLSVQRAELAAARATQRRERANLAFEQDKADAETERAARLAAQGFLSQAALQDARRKQRPAAPAAGAGARGRRRRDGHARAVAARARTRRRRPRRRPAPGARAPRPASRRARPCAGA